MKALTPQTEVTKFLDLKKSAVSKIWKRLGEEDEGSHEIEFHKRGPRGSNYYTTNCENCFLGKEKKTCRKESIDDITTIIKENFGIKMPKDYFEQIKFNQGLLKLRRILREAVRSKDTRLDENLNRVVWEMFQSLITQSMQRRAKEGDYAVRIDGILENFPVLFSMGWQIGNVSGMEFLKGMSIKLLEKLGLKPDMKMTNEMEKKAQEFILEEINRFSKN